MRKFLSLGITALFLFSCGIMDDNGYSNTGGVSVSVVQNAKLPPDDLGNKFTLFNEEFKKIRTIKGHPNLNPSLFTQYMNKNKDMSVYVYTDIIKHKEEALAVFKQQLTYRGNYKPELKYYKNAIYTTGFDEKLNLTYIMIGTYDSEKMISRIKLVMSSYSDDIITRLNKFGKDKIFADIYNLGKY